MSAAIGGAWTGCPGTAMAGRRIPKFVANADRRDHCLDVWKEPPGPRRPRPVEPAADPRPWRCRRRDGRQGGQGRSIRDATLPIRSAPGRRTNPSRGPRAWNRGHFAHGPRPLGHGFPHVQKARDWTSRTPQGGKNTERTDDRQHAAPFRPDFPITSLKSGLIGLRWQKPLIALSWRFGPVVPVAVPRDRAAAHRSETTCRGLSPRSAAPRSPAERPTPRRAPAGLPR